MNIERALKLKKGQIVSCPADRGEPAYIGKVAQENVVTETAQICDAGKYGKYIWVLVQTPFGRKTTWPSNRLG